MANCIALLYDLRHTGTRRRPTIKKSKTDLLDAEDGDGDIGAHETLTLCSNKHALSIDYMNVK